MILLNVIEKNTSDWYDEINSWGAEHIELLLSMFAVSLILVIALIIAIYKIVKIKRKSESRLAEKNMEIRDVNQKMLASINYASRIQGAVISSIVDVKAIFPENFVLYRPRDIVGGDYYRAIRCGRYSVMITADCTGHGIPGALLSMLGISALREYLVTEYDAENPGTVLDRMRTFIKSTLVSTGRCMLDDGMDMTICSFDFEKMEIRYAIANQTALIIRGNNAIKLKGDSMPVGRYIAEKEHFQTLTVKIEKGDMVYMFSDGLQDQLGGNDNKKFLLKNLITTLIDIHNEPLNEQRIALEQEIISWRGGISQIDDMTMVGIKV
ncbi:MAG: serine/threonine-protein phosphatase [Bacteroidales bacterium]|nr:serine/threonine-protein phosphatase [Bacteroidales bacterium]